MSKKITIKKEQLADILQTESEITGKEFSSIMSRVEQTSTELPHWVVILLKVIAYAIGIILAGYGTAASAQTLFLH